MSNPYTSLEQSAFWAPAVGRRHMLDIDALWQAPFPIRKKDHIATFGSCFAQHFSRALVARDFTWFDAEPAPQGLPEAEARTFNYGVFSARTSNIYTTSLMCQWTEWALAEQKPPDIHWQKDGRIFDPFRPAVEPGGFSSVEEMTASRALCIEAFGRAVLDCDILVFTLGLTESWWDAAGFEYPMCPGTVAGTFDAEAHHFRNQDYPFVRSRLMRAISLIRSARRSAGKRALRILLTVSPVPLTATNSGNHVLVATTESKSVLRAVAGNIARTLSNVSYFPSYEIISSPPFRGMFFEPNQRSVNQNGVKHVMQTFFAGLSDTTSDTSANKPAVPRTATKTAQEPVRSAEDLACEEELLAAFGPKA